MEAEAPYLLLNPISGIGVAELIFELGRYPVGILYTLLGRAQGTHTFEVVDARGLAATGTVTVEFSEFSITPASTSIESGSSQVFVLSGGVPPYTCEPTGGSLTPLEIAESGGSTRFTPTRVFDQATLSIVCSDQAGQTAFADVTVEPLPTPAPTPLPTATPGNPVVLPASASLTVGQQQAFAISGGVPPYTVTASGGTPASGTVSESGGVFQYTASAVGGFDILVTDSAGKSGGAAVTNTAAAALSVSPSGPLTLASEANQQIVVTGGVPPYQISLILGLAGSVSSTTVDDGVPFLYEAPNSASSGAILVTDSAPAANRVSVSVSVAAP